MRGLANKVVLITGGGIGQALSRPFAAENAAVIAADINAEALGRTRQAVLAAGGRCETRILDITDYPAVQTAVGAVAATHGRIDALVNNAGWDAPMQFIDTDPEFWTKVIAINLRGPLNLQHTVLPIMIAQGGGKIVNIASDAGRVGFSGEAVYSRPARVASSPSARRSHARWRRSIFASTLCLSGAYRDTAAGVVSRRRRLRQKAL